ncbi:hypothetical protein Ssi02_44780 [Sinosporangium siamense]|uniref:Uncharacterized protein n=2 Tax=Sinosporangium siamense TaxID=1367973 RepID=A0A919V9F2_9ACTN|nr:hypothetical protein Ssi02_44780 [Sinosporangium siamense]
MITDAETEALIRLARDRRAQTIAIGSGRTPRALESARLIEAVWERTGGTILTMITWPEIGASWLRHASRFADADPDLWVMTGAATGWAQMTRRLLWSTPWRPERTLATAAIGDPRTLALVGLINLNGLAGTTAHGTTWRVEDDTFHYPARTQEGP